MEIKHRTPSGPAAAAFLSAGLGSLVLGLTVVGAEMSEGLKETLNLYDPVGPLSGKTSAAVAVYLIAWLVLHSAWKGKDVDFDRTMKLSWLLIALGVLLTFPPIFVLFAGE